MTLLRSPRAETKVNAKTCKAPGCKAKFFPARAFQSWCSPECGYAILKAKEAKDQEAKAKTERKADSAKRYELRPLKWFHAKAKKAVHKFIRLRDAGDPCISCGCTTAAQWDAGHYVSVGADSSLRYDFANIHKQCSVCNQHKSANLILYRKNLIPKIGEAEVDRLEGPQPVHKWTRDELLAIEHSAKHSTKELLETA